MICCIMIYCIVCWITLSDVTLERSTKLQSLQSKYNKLNLVKTRVKPMLLKKAKYIYSESPPPIFQFLKGSQKIECYNLHHRVECVHSKYVLLWTLGCRKHSDSQPDNQMYLCETPWCSADQTNIYPYSPILINNSSCTTLSLSYSFVL